MIKGLWSPRKAVPLVILMLVGILVLAGCWTKNITTPYYTQTTSYYCGAASAQMILNSQNLGIYVASQDTLYNYIHSHNICTGWASDPRGLSDVLNHYGNSHTPPAYFVAYTPSSQDDGIKKLAYTIDHYGVPPASLVYGCAHWVVVRGVITDVQPTSSPSYTIYGFFVNDPWYGTNSLGENKYVTINSWKTDYFTGCEWCGSGTGNKFISVVDPEPPQAINLQFPKILERRAQIISAREAQDFAAEAMKQFESQKEYQKGFTEPLEVMRASKIGTPVLVKRSDRQQDAYYIVPLMRGNLTSGAILIDGYSGQLLEATYVKKPVEYTARLMPDKARELFRKNIPTLRIRPELLKEIQIPGRISFSSEAQAAENIREMKTIQQLNIKPSEVNVTSMELVWEPSADSQNPYYPLWRATGTIRNVKEARVIGYMDFKGRMIGDITKAEKVPLKGGGLKPQEQK